MTNSLDLQVDFLEGTPKTNPALPIGITKSVGCQGTIVMNSNLAETDLVGVQLFALYEGSNGPQPLPHVLPSNPRDLNLVVSYDGSYIEKTITTNRDDGAVELFLTFTSSCDGQDRVLYDELPGLRVKLINAITPPFRARVHKSDITETGLNDGRAELEIIGGSGSYRTKWESLDGPFEELDRDMVEDLAPGRYRLKVTDTLTNQVADPVDFDIFEPLTVILTTRNITNRGMNDGKVATSALGGSGFLQYEWLGPEGFIEDENLPPITYPQDFSCQNESFISLEEGEFDNFILRDSPPSIQNLGPGTYRLAVRDLVLGFTRYNFVEIKEPAMRVSLVPKHIFEYGADDGAIRINIDGGSGNNRYFWVGPYGWTYQTNQLAQAQLRDLMPGWYILTVEDVTRNEFATVSVEIQEHQQIWLRHEVKTPTSETSRDGSLVLDHTGGLGPFEYEWRGPGVDGVTERDVDNLTVGQYTVTLRDLGSEQTAVNTIELRVDEQCELLSAQLVVVPITCDNPGQLRVVASGGSGNYTFLWEGPGIDTRFNARDTTINSREPGVYEVRVVDDELAFQTTLRGELKLEGLQVTTTVQNVTTNGGSDGSIEATVTGCSGQYRYQWFEIDAQGNMSGCVQENGTILDGRRAGLYGVKVTDLLTRQTKTVKVTLTEPTPHPVIKYDITNPWEWEREQGIIEVEVGGGSGLYTYYWQNQEGQVFNTDSIVGVPAGEYSFLFEDIDNDVNFSDKILVRPAPRYPLDVTVKTFDVTEFGLDDGSVMVSVTGGIRPYRFIFYQRDILGNWEVIRDDDFPSQDQINQSNGVMTNLVPGRYRVNVFDRAGSEVETQYTISTPMPLPLEVNLTAQTITIPGGSDGILIANVIGGVPPYQYYWYKNDPLTGIMNELIFDANIPNDGIITDLSRGEYVVRVVDAICQEASDYRLLDDGSFDPCEGKENFDAFTFGPNQVTFDKSNLQSFDFEIKVLRIECCPCCEDPLMIEWVHDIAGLVVNGQGTNNNFFEGVFQNSLCLDNTNDVLTIPITIEPDALPKTGTLYFRLSARCNLKSLNPNLHMIPNPSFLITDSPIFLDIRITN